MFIRRRTEDDIEAATSVDMRSLRDPQPDEERVQNPEVCCLQNYSCSCAKSHSLCKKPRASLWATRAFAAYHLSQSSPHRTFGVSARPDPLLTLLLIRSGWWSLGCARTLAVCLCQMLVITMAGSARVMAAIMTHLEGLARTWLHTTSRFQNIALSMRIH